VDEVGHKEEWNQRGQQRGDEESDIHVGSITTGSEEEKLQPASQREGVEQRMKRDDGAIL
jgi:hypothetical protein